MGRLFLSERRCRCKSLFASFAPTHLPIVPSYPYNPPRGASGASCSFPAGGCRIMAITSGFQPDEAGSIPATRSIRLRSCGSYAEISLCLNLNAGCLGEVRKRSRANPFVLPDSRTTSMFRGSQIIGIRVPRRSFERSEGRSQTLQCDYAHNVCPRVT